MTNQMQQGLKIVRHFNAPKQVVFNAFTTAEALAAWWGPAGMSVTVSSFDFKPGGNFHYKMDANGQAMWGLFKYRTIHRPDLIEFVSSFSDEAGNICTSPFPMDFPLEILNIISFTEADGTTTMTLEGHPINATAAQEETYNTIKDNMREGFGGTFDQLERYLGLA